MVAATDVAEAIAAGPGDTVRLGLGVGVSVTVAGGRGKTVDGPSEPGDAVVVAPDGGGLAAPLAGAAVWVAAMLPGMEGMAMGGSVAIGFGVADGSRTTAADLANRRSALSAVMAKSENPRETASYPI